MASIFILQVILAEIADLTKIQKAISYLSIFILHAQNTIDWYQIGEQSGGDLHGWNYSFHIILILAFLVGLVWLQIRARIYDPNQQDHIS